MIRQTFEINEQIILTLFHKEFGEYPKERIIEEKIKISNHEVTFKECWFEPEEVFEIQYDTKRSNFLEIENEKNPYSAFCCNCEEYINIEKSELSNEFLKDMESYKKMSDFVVEHSGYNLLRNPYSIENTLIFTKTEVSIERYNQNGVVKLIINKPNDYELLINIKFKSGSNIVKVTSFTTLENVITFPDKEGWSLFDIEFYHENKPVFIEQNVSWIESVHISMNIITSQQEIELRRVKKKIKFQEHSSDVLIAGEPISDDILEEYSYRSQELKSKLNSKYKFELLTENEYERALDIFKEITSNLNFEELWIFDPYFVDVQSGYDKTYDIMAILSTNLKLKKFIVYEQGKGKIEQYKESIKDLIQIFSRSSTTLTLIGTQKHFHDRFIFLKSSKRISGYQLGTSLNSFGENYSTINELTAADSRCVFDVLKRDLLKTELILSEDLTK